MEDDMKQKIIELIDGADEKELADVLVTALQMHLSSLERQQKQIEQEIAKTKEQLEQLSGPPANSPPRRRRGPRVSDVIRQALRDAGGPLPLAKITAAVAKATGRPLTDSLSSYVSQLVKREPAIRRLSRGTYAITL